MTPSRTKFAFPLTNFPFLRLCVTLTHMFRSFAIVPAAGRSERMGRPKLLLPVAGRPVIDHVLTAWTASVVTRTIVVVRADDTVLLMRCHAFPVDIVTPSQPPTDMKASVQLALAYLAEQYAPAESDAWLLAPADLPRLSTGLIDELLEAYDPAEAIAVAPTFAGRRGHPIVMPWRMARDVHALAADEGLNALVARTPCREIPCDNATQWQDLNDPAEYGSLLNETASKATGF
jgi:molybdenum cofactor cytidylyltransferase